MNSKLVGFYQVNVFLLIPKVQHHKSLLTKILKVNPGTSCIFMSSGHLNSDFVVELFCDVDHWVVNVISQDTFGNQSSGARPTELFGGFLIIAAFVNLSS